MPLHDQDIKYIAKKFSIPLKSAYKITEEEKDTELLLHEISVKAIQKEDVLKLTFFTYIKLIVYRYSYDTGFDINEKLYIAKTIYYNYLNIKRELLNIELIIDKNGPSEEKSRYLLLLGGLFYDIIHPAFLFFGYMEFIAAGFRSELELRSLSRHVEDWISILREIKKRGWFDPIDRSKIKRSIIKPRLLLTS